jgi:hypothetical protein
MAHNRYFTIEANDPNLDEIAQVFVGELDTQRYSLDGTKIVIKLHEGDHSEYGFLAQYQEYNNDQILDVLQTAEWTGVPTR